MIKHYCDKCGRILFENKIDGRFNTVVTLKNTDKKENYKTYELCDNCFYEFAERSLSRIGDSDFYSNMKGLPPIDVIK